MCLLFFKINDNCNNDEQRLVLVNNRDECWLRPSKTADFWTTNRSCISGLDQEPGKEGGTWFGANRHGRVACLVNISQPQDKTKKGRGFLVNGFLTTTESIESYAELVSSQRDDYNGFVLTLIELGRTESKVARVTNDKQTNTPVLFMRPSPQECYAVGNSSVDSWWCKIGEGENKFRNIVQTHDTVSSKDKLTEGLFTMMADKTRYLPDPLLQKAGENCGWAQETINSKSALFVWDPARQYGTRTTTVLTVDKVGNCDYTEKNLQIPPKADALQWSTSHHRFHLQSASSL